MIGERMKSLYVPVLVLLAVALVLLSGCAKKTFRGTLASTGGTPATTVSETSPLGSDASAQDDDRMAQFSGSYPDEPDQGMGETQAPSESFESFGQSLSEEGSMKEDPDSSGAGDQYWAGRQVGERLAADAGLQDVYFEFDSWRLTEQAKHELNSHGEWIKANQNRTITIEGHCDERGTQDYNYALGEKRAAVVQSYLIALGIPSDQFTILSYGKDRPACYEPSESCHRQNRRAHFLLNIDLAKN